MGGDYAIEERGGEIVVEAGGSEEWLGETGEGLRARLVVCTALQAHAEAGIDVFIDEPESYLLPQMLGEVVATACPDGYRHGPGIVVVAVHDARAAERIVEEALEHCPHALTATLVEHGRVASTLHGDEARTILYKLR